MADAKDERRPAGELQATVMAALWAADGPRTPGQVQADLAVDLARTTVTTILTRLHDKGVVDRRVAALLAPPVDRPRTASWIALLLAACTAVSACAAATGVITFHRDVEVAQGEAPR
jgi:predicted small secreted protein